jgi:hypothetical protein
MKMKRYASFEKYLADQAPRNRAVIRALRKLVRHVKVLKPSDIDERAMGALLRQAVR